MCREQLGSKKLKRKDGLTVEFMVLKRRTRCSRERMRGQMKDTS